MTDRLYLKRSGRARSAAVERYMRILRLADAGGAAGADIRGWLYEDGAGVINPPRRGSGGVYAGASGLHNIRRGNPTAPVYEAAGASQEARHGEDERTQRRVTAAALDGAARVREAASEGMPMVRAARETGAALFYGGTGRGETVLREAMGAGVRTGGAVGAYSGTARGGAVGEKLFGGAGKTAAELLGLRESAVFSSEGRVSNVEINVRQHNENSIGADTDMEAVLDAWAGDFARKLYVSAEGVYM